MKLLPESLGSIGKSLKEISTNSVTIRKEIRNLTSESADISIGSIGSPSDGILC